MLLKNTSARLLTVNHKGEKYRILPGNNPAVEVPDAACKSDFVKGLLANGSLMQVAKVETVTEPDERDELIAELESLGVDVDNRWGVERLKKELEQALGGE